MVVYRLLQGPLRHQTFTLRLVLLQIAVDVFPFVGELLSEKVLVCATARFRSHVSPSRHRAACFLPEHRS